VTLPIPTVPTPADLADIQGLVYRGWSDHPWSVFVFARLPAEVARARAWLALVEPEVASARVGTTAPGDRCQLALTAHGLAALGVPDDALAGLPQEATLGMAARRHILGDPDHPPRQFGGSPDDVDVLVMLYARTEPARAALLDRHRAQLVAAGATVVAEELTTPIGSHEHFGFADGLSQPFVPGLHDHARDGHAEVATGEIVLGYQNSYGRLPQSPRTADFDLGRNGTYLVFRKLAQDVAGLWSWLDKQAAALAPEGEAHRALTELLGAKLVGRWRSGASLVLAPDADAPRLAATNTFGYLSEDPDGRRCPIASHVRRANPRDARGGSADDSADVVKRHRIVRRGRSYGPRLEVDAAITTDDGQARGLYFIALQASIARGFEFIQQTWLSNPGFHGLHDEPDPLVGNGGGYLTIPAAPLRLRLAGVPPVVRLVGGEYFLLPSRAAIAWMARPVAPG
jgi:Dyp-type peroxidase family